MIQDHKVCTKCKADKPASYFHFKRTKRKDGAVHVCLRAICKACCAEVAKDWDDRNRDKRRAYSRRWHRKNNLGVGSIDYVKMQESQWHSCAICGVTDTARRLDIDHCHNSLRIRGLLCTNCNNGLGRFKDDPDLLRKAAEYLENSQEFQVLGEVFSRRFTAVM